MGPEQKQQEQIRFSRAHKSTNNATKPTTTISDATTNTTANAAKTKPADAANAAQNRFLKIHLLKSKNCDTFAVFELKKRPFAVIYNLYNMNYFILTYGCQMNQSDSERIAAKLENENLKTSLKMDEAALIVVNMCSVRQSAVDRTWGLIPKFQKLKKKNLKITILTGCILKEDRKKFQGKFDFILNIDDLNNWSEKIKVASVKNEGLKNYFEIRPKYQTKFSAPIPISNGCNNFCSYCVVPYARGKEKCRDHQEIIKEVKEVIKNGVKEIWLLGQNVNSYKSGGINFPKLLKMVNGIPGNFWIRFMSPHPNDFSNELIETMAKCQKITPYLNLPVQAGDNKTLKKMNRHYTTGDYKKLVEKIRKAIPGITLSTDVIVGFPGETKKQFENTAKLFREAGFDMAYISEYSPRPGTAAQKLKDDVPHREKEKRREILTEIIKKSALQKNKKFIGKIVNVLVESKNKDFLIGKSRHYKTVKFKSNKNLVGKFVKVKIIGALPWGLKGTLL